MRRIRVLVFASLLLAVQIVLTRYAVINIPDVVRIGFSFLPLALSAMLFGPVVAGTQGAAEDLIGFFMVPSGPYFPGFTISAFLKGAIYGLILYKKPKSILRITIAVLIVSIFVDLGMNTLWLTILYHKAAGAILGARLLDQAIMLPIKVSMIYATWEGAGNMLDRKYILGRV